MAAREKTISARQTLPVILSPEQCSLVAHHTGDGWSLEVEDVDGNIVALLAWPKSWPEEVTAKQLVGFGFNIV